MKTSVSMPVKNFPRLVSDIGGTNARFAIEIAPYQYENQQTLSCLDFECLSDAVTFYLSNTGYLGQIKHGALAVPSPIVDDILFMMNNPWNNSSMSEEKAKLNFETLIFINDFHALALAIPHLPKNELVQFGGEANHNSTLPISIIGAGTGLGMATLVQHPNKVDYLAVPAEGGRSTFAAVTTEEFEIWQYVHKNFHHVSVERIVSGPGLQLTYEALCHIHRIPLPKVLPDPSEITKRAIEHSDYISIKALEHFCRILGTVSSNFVCMTNALTGVYIGGGIIPKILDFFLKSDFRWRFEDKGRYRQFLSKVPAYIIMSQYPAMYGSSYALDTYLEKGYIP